MVKVKFKSAKKPTTATFREVSENVVELVGPARNQSGFRVLNDSGRVIGNYDDYIYVKQRVKNGYQYTNQGGEQ